MNVRTALSLLVLLAATFNPAAAADAVDVIAPESAPADAVKVDITKMKFVPATIEIEAGSTVTWTNHDAVPHNVYLPAPIEVIGDMLRAGKSLALTFNTPGEYSYICSPHPVHEGQGDGEAEVVNARNVPAPEIEIMWVPYNLLSPLKAESPRPAILASEAATNVRDFVVGFFLRNPVTRNWETDILLSASGQDEPITLGGRNGTMQASGNRSGKLEETYLYAAGKSAVSALTACYEHVVKQLEEMILQYGRGIELVGWRVADIEHGARWRCIPFRPSALDGILPGCDVPPAYDEVLRLYREARCTTSARWRLICAGASSMLSSPGESPSVSMETTCWSITAFLLLPTIC